ncbi:FUSC family protein [Rummeliibacillus sp. JY-2-4R]
MLKISKVKKSISKRPSIIKQALTVNKKPFPWVKAFCAGLSAALPVIIGLLLGNLQNGLVAGMGGMAFLYVFNIPYAQRAKKIFFVVLGLTLVSYLGTIAAPYPLATSILMGIIGFAAIFIFGTLKIPGPSAIFFVLVFAMTTGMPVNPDLAPLRSGLVFLGGLLAWVIAMIGWIANQHGPETVVVKRLYLELASFIDSVGTEKFNSTRNRVVTSLKQAEETLVAGYIPWRFTETFNRLYVLKNQADKIFLYILENFSDTSSSMPVELGESFRELAHSIDNKKKTLPKAIIQPDHMNPSIAQLFERIYDADAIRLEPSSKINQLIRISRPSLKDVFLGAFDKNSIVFITAIRYGVVLAIASIIAYQFNFNRSFWVPLSCAAVMSGATIVATYHRAIQRAIGTIFGILIASLILTTHPTGYMIAFLILLFTFITELFIVKNYGLAALFFTPNALLMAESTSIGGAEFAYFASTRLIDILVGTAIGLIGVLVIGRRSASSRLPHLVSKTLRSQAQFLHTLFSEQRGFFNLAKSRERIKMQINLNNLKTLYNTASGEIPVNQNKLDYYWPIIFYIEQLGYLIENCSKDTNRPVLSDKTLAQLLLVFETMAKATAEEQSTVLKNVPEIEDYPSIQKEIISLQNALLKSEEVS